MIGGGLLVPRRDQRERPGQEEAAAETRVGRVGDRSDADERLPAVSDA